MVIGDLDNTIFTFGSVQVSRVCDARQPLAGGSPGW
jgi:hypothetical protein